MYQALYRKYRPTSFEDMVGQDIIKKTITNSLINNKISHAYLFCGPRGTGKTSAAKLIAKLINCKDLKDGKTCGKCDFCINFDNESLDVIEIDAASNNGVDEIRELKNKINIMPYIGKYKIYIIDEVHMLSIGAFNALLKTLEEPPKHIIFILATTEINKIPETIVSRCQRFDFKRISEQNIVDRLKHICDRENIACDDEVLNKISEISNGGLRDAIGLLDKLISYNGDKIITLKELNEVSYIPCVEDVEKLVNYIQMYDIKNYVKLVNELYNNGKDIIKLVDEMIIFLRNKILLKNDKNKEFLLRMLEYLNDLSLKMKNSSFPKILLETVIIKFNTDKQAEFNPEAPVLKVIKEEEIVIDSYEKLKTLRINNTLALASKKMLSKIKSEWETLPQFLVGNKKYKEINFLNDVEIVAASENNIMISIKYNSIFDNALNNFILIQECIEGFLNRNCKIILLSDSEWSKIKKDYINSIKDDNKYKYIEEKVELNEIFEKER